MIKHMKFLRTILVAALVLAGISAQAGDVFRFGPRLGMEVNSMRLNSGIFQNDNRAGFTGGLEMEATIPVVNLGFDLSVMYVHRVNRNAALNAGIPADDAALIASDNYRNRDYIEIPLNLKYKIGLPVVGRIVTPYVFTGPSFAVLASKREITNAYKNKAFDLAWNFGIGLQLVNHLQIGASYGLGLTKTVETLTSYQGAAPIEGKNNYWTVTAAWLF